MVEFQELIPSEPVGSRMVHFLNTGADEQSANERTDKAEHRGWKPSNPMGSMNPSVLWIDGDQLYCFTQLMNPGLASFPRRVIPRQDYGTVYAIDGIQESMTAAIAVQDGRELRGASQTLCCFRCISSPAILA